MTDATGAGAVDALPLTGERTMPGVASENYWFRRHEAAYRHAAAQLAHVSGPLLDIGAGEGYGADALAQTGDRTVIALDYDPGAVGHLARRYPRLTPVRANLAALPCASHSLAAITALQVIEHVWDHPQFIAECHRTLRPGGLLVLSTPNRLTFSPDPGRARNPFHTHEFTDPELAGLVSAHGLTVLARQGLNAGPTVTGLDARYGPGGFVAAQLESPPQHWSTTLTADVSAVTAADFVITSHAGPDCLDLILTARR